MQLIYGGGRVGVMGEISKAVLEKGGHVTGVIPKGLFDREVAFKELSDLRIVSSMHERKALMVELSDAFIALPGGLGTFEEFLEALTWAQLGLHQKPIGLVNVCQFYTKLLDFLDQAVEEGFLAHEHRATLLVEDNPERLLTRLQTFRPPRIDKTDWALGMNK
jgi:uncharacterized protein (TIGR00730 family)